ncbi:helix-turn-helix domain-containing protein [Sinorhizobium medicae]|nr:helix-turn-helix domain-containing protein [Sinorhizobium medicae]
MKPPMTGLPRPDEQISYIASREVARRHLCAICRCSALKPARDLLNAGGSTVTQIAFDCGFSSSQYFATCYKKRFGFSPQDTRREPRLMACSGG